MVMVDVATGALLVGDREQTHSVDEPVVVTVAPVVEAESFDDAFWRLAGVAYRAAFRVIGIPAEAEDVAAEAVARASSRWRRLSTPADGWVATVAARLAIDRQRKAWRNLPLSEDSDGKLAGGRVSPDVSGLDIESHLDLVRALSELPRRQREAVSLRYLSGFPEKEIAELMNCSTSSVQTHTRRGLAALRTNLAIDELPLLGPRVASKPTTDPSAKSTLEPTSTTGRPDMSACNKEIIP